MIHVNAKPIIGNNNLFKFEIEIDDSGLIDKVIPELKFDNNWITKRK